MEMQDQEDMEEQEDMVEDLEDMVEDREDMEVQEGQVDILVRLLPLLQQEEVDFGQEWQQVVCCPICLGQVMGITQGMAGDMEQDTVATGDQVDIPVDFPADFLAGQDRHPDSVEHLDVKQTGIMNQTYIQYLTMCE